MGQSKIGAKDTATSARGYRRSDVRSCGCRVGGERGRREVVGYCDKCRPRRVGTHSMGAGQ